MRKTISSSLLILLVVGCNAQEKQTQGELHQYDFNYTTYTNLLVENVSHGRVNYANIKANRSLIDSLVANIGKANLDRTSVDQMLAFYCNAYNILTIRSIVDAYPVESIKDIDGVWDRKKWLVAGEQLTLNEIEHEILRKRFAEPRIHVAINCASAGCPPLLPVPFYPDSLDVQFTRAAVNFTNSNNHNVFDPASKTARISSIFDWFGDDFVASYYRSDRFNSLSKKENAAVNFLLQHLPQDEMVQLMELDWKVAYLDYDWALNDIE